MFSNSLEFSDEDDANESYNEKHLQNLEVFSLNLRTNSPITSQLVHFLVSTCPHLDRIETLLSWNLEGLDYDLLVSHGKSVMFARKNHWSLPWKTEDGCVHDLESDNVVAGQGGMGDLFDIR